jgi:hypothetical protein
MMLVKRKECTKIRCLAWFSGKHQRKMHELHVALGRILDFA